MISISHIDSILREEKITNTSIRMNYEDVEAKIVERFSVALEGWPASCGKVRNPGNIGPKKDLICLANALTSDECRWVKLTEEELEDRKGENERRQQAGEAVYKSRARKKSTARPPVNSIKSAATVQSSDDEGECGSGARSADDDESGSGASSGDDDD
jgi:hypothetical protein